MYWIRAGRAGFRREFGGLYTATQHPGGPIIRFPESQVLSTTVFNYYWPLFHSVWNEIKCPAAYDSDLEFVAVTMRELVEEETGEQMMDRVRVRCDWLAQTSVDQLEIQERPVVHLYKGLTGGFARQAHRHLCFA